MQVHDDTLADRLDELLAMTAREFGIDPARLRGDTQVADLGDVSGWLTLLSALDARYGLRLPVAPDLRIDTVADLLKLLPRA
jgi:hypothetical protein